MPFSASDTYTTSSNVDLWNNWTQYVTKYDASSFYNWEQDNLPLYDIEERTYENWEQHGYPTSCVPGFALVVSADAPAADVVCNKSLFTTVSGAIEALPQHIRFPVIIEVASHKDLGELKLHNIKIGYRGSLEIINRNFAKVLSAYSSTKTINQTATSLGHGLVTSFTSADVSNVLRDSSALGLPSKSTTLSGTSPVDERFVEVNTIVGIPGKGVSDDLSVKLSVAIKDGAIVSTGTANNFTLTPYDLQSTDTSIISYDVSTVNQMNGSKILREVPGNTETNVVGAIYGNAFDSISVKDCDGPIYIRNFFADGEGVRDVPILIENSNVFLENCAAVRGREAGVKFVNSTSIISRGLTAYRNYGLSGWGNRVADSNGAGLKLVNSEVELKHERFELDKYARSNSAWDTSALPVDFLLNFSRNDYGILLENSTLKGGTNTNIAPLSNPSYLQCEHNTKAGLMLRNSVLDLDGCLDVYNNNYGIKSNNSIIKVNQVSVEGNTRIGYHGIASQFLYNKDTTLIDNFAVDRTLWNKRAQTEFLQNGQNIRLEAGSILEPVYCSGMPDKYGEFLCAYPHGNMDDTTPSSLLDLKGQAPNVEILGGSTGKFVGLRGIRDDVYSNNDPGTDLTSYGDIVLVDGGSTALFHGTNKHATVIVGPDTSVRQYNKAGVCAKNNSSVRFSGPTFIGQYGVDVLATDNSVATFGPPFRDDGAELKDYFDLFDKSNHTSVELHSTRACLVADNNSTINMEDLGNFSGTWAETPTFGAAEAAQYGTPAFSPMASACSAGSMQFYPNPADNNLAGVVSLSGTDNLTANGLSMTTLNAFDPAAKAFTTKNSGTTFYNHMLHDPLNAGFDNEAYSLGGMCVRSLNGSRINIRNVHFLTGYSHAPSGVYNDASGGYPGLTTDSDKCKRLFIWNIDDTSELKAELVSVFALYPGYEAGMIAKGYHGPGAYWTSGAGASLPDDVSASYSCPFDTPDTGSFAILDQYGKGEELHLAASSLSGVEPYKTILKDVPAEVQNLVLSSFYFNYGYKESKNLGPFRLYFAVDPTVNKLQVAASGYYGASSLHAPFRGDNAGVLGPAVQLMSQGYSLSGNVSAVSVSGDPWWDSLKQFTGDRHSLAASGFCPSAFAASGYYYTKDFVAPAFTRVFLDESASNLFGNAKNASTGKSNRPKLVTIFDSKRIESGDDMSVSGAGGAGLHSLASFDLNKRN
jgi:hypothetical protein